MGGKSGDEGEDELVCVWRDENNRDW